MTLLAPLMLALAAAAAVPIVIHFLRRRSGTEVIFPATRYVQRAEREHSRELRLRNVGVMLLRVVALVLIALAAARPILGGRSGFSRTALAVVIDNSMSSGAVHDGALVLDRLKQAAASAIRALEPGDRAWIVTADGRIAGGSTDGLLAGISRLKPLPMRPDNAALMKSAAAAVGSVAGSRSVIAVLTDAQRSQWTGPLEAENADVRVFVPQTSGIRNRHVAEARPVSPRWAPQGAVQIGVSGAEPASFVASLSDGSTIRGTAGGGGRPVRVRFQPRARGWVRGSVAIERDELAADDVRHFAVWVGDLPGARVDASAGAFAVAAVEALSAAKRITNGSGTAIVAADAARALPAILLPPADPVRIGAANRELAKLGVPWRFGVRRNAAATVVADSSVLRGSVGTSARYELLRQGNAGNAARTLATAGGEPWLVAGDGYVLFASPIDPSWTTLPVSPAFPPLIESLLSETQTSGSRVLIQATPGSKVVLPPWSDGIESESGSRVNSDGWMPADQGVFYLLADGDTAGAVVVNAPLAESDLRNHSARDLAALFRGGRAVPFESHSSWTAGFLAAGSRQLTAPLLFATLALLLAEMVARSGMTFRRR